MSVKVTAPAGITEITVNGLHQWDYGQQLEVVCEGLPTLVEVHFACKGMSEAVVRACSVSAAGTFTAAIPDLCLEQTTPICAWVVAIGASSGTTLLKITMPIIERTKPAASESIPEEVGDKYTEAVAAINEQIARLENGEIVVCQAQSSKVLDDCASSSYSTTTGGFAISETGLYMVTATRNNGTTVSAFIAVTDLDSRGAYGSNCEHSNCEFTTPLYEGGTRTIKFDPDADLTYLCCYKLAAL